MSRYTTEVRFICETIAGLDTSGGYDDINTIITAAAPWFFPSFPIFDEAYRLPLETKILKHFYTREIGEETFGLFKLRLDAKLNTIMPVYNKLYESELLEFNPLYTTDYQKTHEGSSGSNSTNSENYQSEQQSSDTVSAEYNDTSNAEDSGSVTSSGTQWDVFSNTPQGQLNNVDENTYLSEARKNTDNNTNTTTNTSTNSVERSEERDLAHSETVESEKTTTAAATNTDAYIEHIAGNTGANYSELLLKFRETIINIDKMIIEELEPLFFQLWK